MAPGERLNILIKELGLDGKRIAESLGVSGASISDWKAGKQPIKKPIALALQALYGVSCEWVLTGQGPMWAVPPALLPAPDHVPIPFIPGAASCGPGGEITEPGPNGRRVSFEADFVGEIIRECGGGTVKDLYLIESIGESMRPSIHPGDQVLINAHLPLRIEPKRGGLFLVRMDPHSADARIKRVRLEANGRLCLDSDAPGFKTVELNLANVPVQSLVIGRVCWISRRVIKDEQPERNW